MNKYTTLGLSLIAAMTLSGCVSSLPLNYAPSSAMTASGSVSVTSFDYLPAKDGKVAPNQVRNSAMGNIHFEQNVDLIIRDAVFKELRFVGVKVDNLDRKLSGDIQEFFIDDLGFHVDWTLRIKYRITTASGVVYESTKQVNKRTAKFANPFGALNEIIKLNIEELLKDPAFLEAIK